jgi:aspartyl/asparaginyl-tRNA synthetase
MCNYSEYLKQKQEIKDNLKVLTQLELLHFSDKKIMTILQINAELLKSLREMLQEERAVVVAN